MSPRRRVLPFLVRSDSNQVASASDKLYFPATSIAFSRTLLSGDAINLSIRARYCGSDSCLRCTIRVISSHCPDGPSTSR
jgi:hypothetical protein